MTTGASAAPRPLSDDALVELARESESSPAQRPGASRVLALGFVAVAIGMLFLPEHRPVSAVAIVVSLLAYAVARQVQIEFTTFYLVPTEAVFVVMWFVIPLATLPLVVGAAMLLAELPGVVRRRQALEATLVLNLAASWHAVGPALVLYLAGAHTPRWHDLPIYAGALLAQFVFDFVTTLVLQHMAVGTVSVGDHLRTLAGAASYDVMLAPLGLLAAFPCYRHPEAMLLLLPVLVIVRRIATEREEKNTRGIELRKAYQDTSYLVGDMIEVGYDEYTGTHSRQLVELVLAVSARLRLTQEEQQLAELTAILHDVGKVRIPAEIINKAGPLDENEWALIKTHTILGEQFLEPRRGLLREVAPLVRSCHERWDGTGYPDQLAGDEIPLVSRIVFTCDAWSAMTTDRAYRSALPLEDAATELRSCAGTHFDPSVVKALITELGL